MALVDYERAWRELEAHVASKPSHGSRDLALKMLELSAKNALDESLPERMLRMYGVQLSEDLRASARDTPPTHDGDSLAAAMEVEPGHRHERAEEVHDGSRNEREAVAL